MITFKDLHLSPAIGDGPEKSCQTSYVNVSLILSSAMIKMAIFVCLFDAVHFNLFLRGKLAVCQYCQNTAKDVYLQSRWV